MYRRILHSTVKTMSLSLLARSRVLFPRQSAERRVSRHQILKFQLFFFNPVAQLQARKFGLAYNLDENNLNGDLLVKMGVEIFVIDANFDDMRTAIELVKKIGPMLIISNS